MICFDNLRRNVTEKEFAKYDLFVVRTNAGFKRANVTLELQKEVISGLLNVGGIIGICIGAILLATILLLLVIYNQIYLKVLYKRYLAKPIPGEKFRGFELTLQKE